MWKKTVWDQIKGEVDFCACGNKFWTYWHKNIDGIKHAMTQCAPCYFNEDKK